MLPPRVSFFALMGRGHTVDVIPAVVDGGEVEIGGGAEQQSLEMQRTAQQKTESRLVQRVHTRKGYWYYSDKTTIHV